MKQQIVNELKDSAKVKLQLADENADIIADIAKLMISSLRNGHKVLFCGNGGSAADAQHLSAELLGKFKMNRKALPSLALNVNTSALTAVANDFGYDMTFERLIEGLGSEGDVLVGLSTSGKSTNVVRAMIKAHQIGMKTVAFVGNSPGTMGKEADICLMIPSDDTPRIQEAHITAGHIICGLIERALFAEDGK